MARRRNLRLRDLGRGQQEWRFAAISDWRGD